LAALVSRRAPPSFDFMKNKQLLIVYASVHGQAELIARRVADVAESATLEPVLRSVRDASASDVAACDEIVVVASVHFGRHSRRITRFVRSNLEQLESKRSAFVSVSGSAAEAATRNLAETYADEFLRATGWNPTVRQLAGGAVKFTKYNPFIRFVTKRAMKAQGKTVDTHRDYDFTDWDAVTRFAASFATS
jgi:menaquinone-dependent protoporphyrinogen oxidase